MWQDSGLRDLIHSCLPGLQLPEGLRIRDHSGLSCSELHAVRGSSMVW